MLTQERLKEVLRYCQETGIFIWCARRRGIRYGCEAGCVNNDGYKVIRIDGVLYSAHCLAWFYMTGEWPRPACDHWDLDKANNRWLNLRLATKSQNGANRPLQSNNKSGLKGARWHKMAAKWESYIKKDGKKIHLGLFASAADAHEAYCIAAEQLYGEFARAA